MPSPARRRSGALLLVAAAFFGVSTLAFLLDGDTLVAGLMGVVAIGLATAGAWRLTDEAPPS
jgi:uncharacterized membrane protein